MISESIDTEKDNKIKNKVFIVTTTLLVLLLSISTCLHIYQIKRNEDLKVDYNKRLEECSNIVFNSRITQISKFKFPINPGRIIRISSYQDVRPAVRSGNGENISNATYHNAIDISCNECTEVFAAKDGVVLTVIKSFYNGTSYTGHPVYGGLVEIMHLDGTRTLYAHLSKTTVEEGDSVKMGELIGLSGGLPGKRGSGQSSGAHLHFAILLNISQYIENYYELTDGKN